MLLMAVGCIPMGAVSIAQTSIFCDSIDYMEWETGKRMEGVAFSMQTFFTKVSSGITMALTTGSLALLGYKAVEDSATVFIGTQTAAFDTWIWPLAMLTPAIASLLYIIPLLFIRYTPEKRSVVEKELKERREAVESK
jgi:Na+/melibiose symporter-like transporter